MSKENKQADLPEHRDKRFDAVRDTWYWNYPSQSAWWFIL